MATTQTQISAEQRLFAVILDLGVKLSLVAFAVFFFVYVSGVLPVTVPLDRLPELWTLPVSEYIQRAGVSRGWNWIALLDHGDSLALACVAFLISISTMCLVGLIQGYARRRDWLYLAITVAIIGVIVLAASGVLITGK
jgi:hypothetical protein